MLNYSCFIVHTTFGWSQLQNSTNSEGKWTSNYYIKYCTKWHFKRVKFLPHHVCSYCQLNQQVESHWPFHRASHLLNEPKMYDYIYKKVLKCTKIGPNSWVILMARTKIGPNSWSHIDSKNSFWLLIPTSGWGTR